MSIIVVLRVVRSFLWDWRFLREGYVLIVVKIFMILNGRKMNILNNVLFYMVREIVRFRIEIVVRVFFLFVWMIFVVI